ncbi:hypothetical protein V6N13_063064 [Hibiscus sabdariffa]
MFHYQRPPISSSHPSTSPWEMPSPAGFFVTFAMIAGAIGVASTIAGINHICRWNDISLPSAASIAENNGGFLNPAYANTTSLHSSN